MDEDNIQFTRYGRRYEDTPKLVRDYKKEIIEKESNGLDYRIMVARAGTKKVHGYFVSEGKLIKLVYRHCRYAKNINKELFNDALGYDVQTIKGSSVMLDGSIEDYEFRIYTIYVKHLSKGNKGIMVNSKLTKEVSPIDLKEYFEGNKQKGKKQNGTNN